MIQALMTSFDLPRRSLATMCGPMLQDAHALRCPGCRRLAVETVRGAVLVFSLWGTLARGSNLQMPRSSCCQLPSNSSYSQLPSNFSRALALYSAEFCSRVAFSHVVEHIP